MKLRHIAASFKRSQVEIPTRVKSDSTIQLTSQINISALDSSHV